MCWLLPSAQLWHYPVFLLPPLIVIALVECFAGYRAWRSLLGLNGAIIGFLAGALFCAQVGGSPMLLLAGAFAGAFAGAALFAMVTPVGGFVFIALSVASLTVLVLRVTGMPPDWVALFSAAAGFSAAVAATAFSRPAAILVTAIGGAQQIASAWCAYYLPADQAPVRDVVDPAEWGTFLALAAAGLLFQIATRGRVRSARLIRPG